MSKLNTVILSSLIGGIFGALGAVISLQINKHDSSTIVAEEIRLVDESGNTRIYLGEANGAPRLYVYGKTGDPEIHIGIEGDGPMIMLSKNNLSSNIALIVDNAGPRIGVDDKAGFVAINMSSHKPGITVSKTEPKFIWKTPLE